MKNNDRLSSIALTSSALIFFLRTPNSGKVRRRILSIVVFLALLSVSSPVSAVTPDRQIGDDDSKPSKIGISYDPSSYTATKSN